ncbi:3ecdcb0c-34a5-4cb8-93a5-85c935ab343e-CDS [Sclerotinia trifoliorum]|uniref:3ecdcb0c-34a5-4cb8-93a5-85c935ab343e-CDS n=1 Tax=Sclerotinia trifoliorum TaxID=28548 RepID=A0A8H2VW75_9HELO|nr:3ecdcb0c-34a5-4cb8-93a5-85c935ab343e-CDS [Sclerotinia trifoliorum]
MVLLGGLEVLAAGYLLKQHLKHKEEKQRLEIEALNLEEQSYRIYSSDRAGPSHRRRRHSHEREHDRAHDRDKGRERGRERSKERSHKSRDSSESKYKYDKRERDDRRDEHRDDKRRSREDLRYSNSRPAKSYYAPPSGHKSHSQSQKPVHPHIGAPSTQWVPPPPPPQHRMNSPPIITTSPSSTHHPQPYPPYQSSSHSLHPTFANEPYAYPPEKLPESMLRPGAPTRGRSSSAPGNIYESPRANTSRVRIVVPGEDELTIPGETRDPPPAYEEVGGRD